MIKLQNAVDAAVVTLWDLLTAVCFAMPIAGALASAKDAKVGWGGYIVAITIALALGGFCAWAMRTVGHAIAARSERHSVSLGEWYFRALYLAAILWIVFALFLGNWATSALMRRLV